MKRIAIIFAGVTSVHFVFTVLTAFGAWAAQEGGGSPTTVSAAILQSLAVPVANAFNFPLPFLLRDNSLTIMLCNSILSAAVVIGGWIVLQRARKRKLNEEPTSGSTI